MSFDDYIFVRPGFLRGVGKAIDLGGVLSRESVLISSTPEEADARALASDFRVVKRDLNAAFKTIAADVKAQEP